MVHREKVFSIFLTMCLTITLVGCGTLTGIPSHGGGKRFAVEQRLVSTTVRGALKQIDLSVLRDKTVFIQMTAVNDQGGGNISGGRGNLLFGLQGITESHPITRQLNTFKVFDLTSSASATTVSSTSGGSSTVSGLDTSILIDSTSINNGTGSSSSTNDGTSTYNTDGTSLSTGTSTSTGTSSSSADSSSSGTNTSTGTGSTTGTSTTDSSSSGSGTSTNTGTSSSGTTTTTGGTTTTQTGTGTSTNTGTNTSTGSGTSTTDSSGSTTSTNTGSNTNTGTSTSNGTSSGTSTSSGSGTSNTTGNGTTNDVGSGSSTSINTGSANSNQNRSMRGFVDTDYHAGTATRSNSKGAQQAISPTPSEIETQTKGTGYKGNYGFEYKGQGRYTNYNVAISDVGILRSILFTYFYLNDVNITTDASNPNIDAVVYVNVDVFGSIRSRFDAVVYNKETVQVQTVMEVMAVNAADRTLMMPPQTGAYEATYDEKYVVWVGPLNKKKTRITHSELEDGLPIDFADLAKAKSSRDQKKKASFTEIKVANAEQIQSLEAQYLQMVQVRKQAQEIKTLQEQILLLQTTPLIETSELIRPQAQILRQTASQQFLDSVDEQHFTVQVFAGVNDRSAQQYIVKNKLQDHAQTVATQRKTGSAYLVLYGDYATVEQARVMAANLSEDVKKNRPWVRQFKQIKDQYVPVR